MSYINFKQADINNFQDKLQQSMTAKISSKFTNFTGNSISVKKATEIMLETLCQNPEIGDPFSLTLRLLDCFEGVTLQIVSFIDSILARVFKNIELFLFHSKINSICFAYEEKIEKLDSALLFDKKLLLEMTKPESYPESAFITPNFKHEISPLGTKNSTRYCADRLTLIGRFSNDCYTNDIFIDNNYMKFSRNHLVIISGSSGYYISDISSEGRLALKLIENNEVEIKVDTIIGLGPVFLMKLETIEPDGTGFIAKFVVVSTEYLYNSAIYVDLLNNGPSVIVGRAPENPKCMINEPNNEYEGNNGKFISKTHLSVRCVDGKILIKNNGKTSGTYVLLKNHKQYAKGAPSDFFKIENGLVYYTNRVSFKFSLE